MRHIAHRGLHTQALENTAAAVQAALDTSYYAGVEIDVRLTLDNTPVLFHDTTLKRMCGGQKDKLRHVAYHALPPLTHPNRSSDRIPTLESVLDKIPPNSTHELWLDLKGKDTPLPQKLVQLLAKYSHLHSQITLLVFHQDWAPYLRRHLPQIRLQLLACYSPYRGKCQPLVTTPQELQCFLEKARSQGAQMVGLEWSPLIQSSIHLVRKQGLEIAVWEGEAGPPDLQCLERLGIRYITRD